MFAGAGIGLDQSAVEAGREVGRWRAEMLERLLRWVFACGAVVAAPSILLAVRTGLPVVAVVDLVALGMLAVVTFGRRISFPVRAGGFVVLVYGLGVALLWSVGLVAQLYLLAVPVLAVVLFGRRVAVIALVVCPATLLVAALVFDRDLAAPAASSSELAGWSVITVNFVFVCWILTYAVGRLIARLEGSLARQRRIVSDASRLALAVEQASDAILLAEPDGRVVYANAAHAELVERLGRGPGVERLDQLRDRDGAPVRLPDGDDPTAWTGTVALYDARSDEHRFVARIWPLGDGDGALTGIVALLRDVTEETRRETRRRRSERLEALGTLASGTAHDFNNVTTTILLVAEQLRARTDDPSVRADMDLIASACQRAGDVVRNMLLFGRQGDLERSAIPLGPTVTDGLHLVRAGLPPLGSSTTRRPAMILSRC